MMKIIGELNFIRSFVHSSLTFSSGTTNMWQYKYDYLGYVCTFVISGEFELSNVQVLVHIPCEPK